LREFVKGKDKGESMTKPVSLSKVLESVDPRRYRSHRAYLIERGMADREQHLREHGWWVAPTTWAFLSKEDRRLEEEFSDRPLSGDEVRVYEISPTGQRITTGTFTGMDNAMHWMRKMLTIPGHGDSRFSVEDASGSTRQVKAEPYTKEDWPGDPKVFAPRDPAASTAHAPGGQEGGPWDRAGMTKAEYRDALRSGEIQ
jgi:hypothetical protein